jgi:hypothetical protein
MDARRAPDPAGKTARRQSLRPAVASGEADKCTALSRPRLQLPPSDGSRVSPTMKRIIMLASASGVAAPILGDRDRVAAAAPRALACSRRQAIGTYCSAFCCEQSKTDGSEGHSDRSARDFGATLRQLSAHLRGQSMQAMCIPCWQGAPRGLVERAVFVQERPRPAGLVPAGARFSTVGEAAVDEEEAWIDGAAGRAALPLIMLSRGVPRRSQVLRSGDRVTVLHSYVAVSS